MNAKYGIKVRTQEGCKFISGWDKNKKAFRFACENHLDNAMSFHSPDEASDKFNEIKNVLSVPEKCFEVHEKSPMFICIIPTE